MAWSEVPSATARQGGQIRTEVSGVGSGGLGKTGKVLSGTDDSGQVSRPFSDFVGVVDETGEFSVNIIVKCAA